MRVHKFIATWKTIKTVVKCRVTIVLYIVLILSESNSHTAKPRLKKQLQDHILILQKQMTTYLTKQISQAKNKINMYIDVPKIF